MIELKCINNRNDQEFEPIKTLYEDAFPFEERRDISKLEGMITDKLMSLKAIKKDDEVVGFVIYWNFDTFLYIEHFAVFPRERGRNIGSEVILYLKRIKNKPIIMEVELPLDEMSKRRIKFYERLGFNLLDYDYMQPSYDGIKPSLKMNLMSNVNLDNTAISEIVKNIEKEVYINNY